MSEEITIDPSSSDPFERVIAEIVSVNRLKRKDYAIDGDPFSNFHDTARAMGIEGFSAIDSADLNVRQKDARIRSLRMNGRTQSPSNETVADTYLDRAVYAIIAYAILKSRITAGMIKTGEITINRVTHGQTPTPMGM